MFSRQSLEKLHEIGDSSEKNIPWLEGIYSIAHLTYSELGQNGYDFDKDGTLSSGSQDYEGTTSAITGDPSLSGTLFSENRKEAWILVPLSFDG